MSGFPYVTDSAIFMDKAGDRSRTDDIQLGKHPENPTGAIKTVDSRHPPSTGPSSCAHDEEAEVAFVSANWGRLPDSMRAAIVAMVRAAP